MKVKYRIISVLVIALVLFSAAALASMVIPANDNAKDNPNVPENSPVKEGLERIDFIHYVKPANPAKAPKTDTCNKLLGVKWKNLPVNYIINPTNPQALSRDFITTAISASSNTWDLETSAKLFDPYTVDSSVQYGVQDFKNAIAFGNYPNDNVIAVTSVWYTPVGRQIVEFDILFNTRFTWGDATANPAVMDLQNIATHEIGHGVGLDDIYSTTCSAVTMYGYSNYGETQKRTLEKPDIAGLQQMYGV